MCVCVYPEGEKSLFSIYGEAFFFPLLFCREQRSGKNRTVLLNRMEKRDSSQWYEWLDAHSSPEFCPFLPWHPQTTRSTHLNCSSLYMFDDVDVECSLPRNCLPFLLRETRSPENGDLRRPELLFLFFSFVSGERGSIAVHDWFPEEIANGYPVDAPDFLPHSVRSEVNPQGYQSLTNSSERSGKGRVSHWSATRIFPSLLWSLTPQWLLTTGQ